MALRTCDVAIVGLGIMGSCALYNLDRRGVDALGFDPLALGDRKGSSHGSSRIYRRFNFENQAYTSLSEDAYRAWRQLEEDAAVKVLLPSVVIEAGRPGSPMVRDSRAVAGSSLGPAKSGSDINAMFPAFRLPEDWEVAVHDSGGILLADVAMRLFRQAAARKIVPQSVAIERTPSEIAITTSDRTRIVAKKLIIAAGPWMTDFVPDLKDYITVTRQVVGWFEPARPALVRYPDFPLFILDAPAGLIYGFPDFEGTGVKAAAHDHGARLAHANDAGQNATDDDLSPVAATLAQYIPAASGRIIHKATCLYTNTKGGDVDGSNADEFIIDRLPNDPRVIVASPCSGHGFKFASAIGRKLADMTLDDAVDAGREFSLRRFARFA